MRSEMTKFQTGQSLVEVLLALGVVVVVITAITAVVVVALDNAQFSKNQNLSRVYAQEAMELVKTIRDRSWATFFGLSSGFYCLPQGGQQLISRVGPNCAGEGDVGVFIREVRKENNHSDCAPTPNVRITVAVDWSDGKCAPCFINSHCPYGNVFCHQTRQVSCYVQSDVVPTP